MKTFICTQCHIVVSDINTVIDNDCIHSWEDISHEYESLVTGGEAYCDDDIHTYDHYCCGQEFNGVFCPICGE